MRPRYSIDSPGKLTMALGSVVRYCWQAPYKRNKKCALSRVLKELSRCRMSQLESIWMFICCGQSLPEKGELNCRKSFKIKWGYICYTRIEHLIGIRELSKSYPWDLTILVPGWLRNLEYGDHENEKHMIGRRETRKSENETYYKPFHSNWRNIWYLEQDKCCHEILCRENRW